MLPNTGGGSEAYRLISLMEPLKHDPFMLQQWPASVIVPQHDEARVRFCKILILIYLDISSKGSQIEIVKLTWSIGSVWEVSFPVCSYLDLVPSIDHRIQTHFRQFSPNYCTTTN